MNIKKFSRNEIHKKQYCVKLFIAKLWRLDNDNRTFLTTGDGTHGGYHANEADIAAIAFLVGVGTLFTAIVIFDIDFVKWVNCSAPFADQVDKTSEMCRR